jgi:DNA primase
MEFATPATQELTVSFGASLDNKEQVKQASDIVELVGSYLQLRRQGRGYVALCPWHDDSRPSLQVNPERQSFKCWVCDIGGDVFSFLMKMEGVEFREALAMLADRAGISLKPTRTRHGGGLSRQVGDSSHDQEVSDSPYDGPISNEPHDEPRGGVNDKRTLYRAMAWAEGKYHDCLLHSPEAEPARRYLQERGVTAESIENFHLGFSPLDRDWILKQAGRSGSRARILEAVGMLCRPQSGGSLFDRFRGRVLFSIRDAQARPVGIGGRLLPELGLTSPAKYVNSPETPLFTKNQLLYGLDLAKDTIRKKDCRTALVMEGYTDVIVAHQYGFTNAVAVLGTALGENHIRILKRFADKIILVLDGDEAGQKRANEVLELFVAQQASLEILTLPDDLDPCDFLLARGAAAFQDLLDHGTVDALEHAFRTATQGVDLDRDVHGSSQALERLISIVAKAPRLRADTTSEDRLREEKVLQRFAAMFRVDETHLRRRMTELRRAGGKAASRRSAPHDGTERGAEETSWKTAPLDGCERELLELLLAYPEQWPLVHERISAEQLAGAACRRIYETTGLLGDAGESPTFDRLMLEFDDPAMKNLLVELDEQGRAKGERMLDPAALLDELFKTFERKEVERRRPAQIVTLREGRLDISQEAELLEAILRQERSRQGISAPMDG